MMQKAIISLLYDAFLTWLLAIDDSWWRTIDSCCMDREEDRHVSQQRLRERVSHVAWIRNIKDIKQVSRNITRPFSYSSFHILLLLLICVCVWHFCMTYFIFRFCLWKKNLILNNKRYIEVRIKYLIWV